jgi:hypothetical protein
MRKFASLVLPGVLVWICALPASGGSLVTSLGSLTQNDMVNWGQLGVAGTAVDGPSAPYTFAAFFSNSGNTVLVGTGGIVELQSPSVESIPGTLLAVNNQFSGPVDILFNTPVSAFGFYIGSAFGGAFTASVQTTTASNQTANYSEAGGPSSPVEFIGVQDATADISGIIVSMTNGNGNNYFSFGTLYAENVLPLVNPILPAVAPVPSSGVPEPSTWLLAGSALGVLIGLRYRARKSNWASTAGRSS